MDCDSCVTDRRDGFGDAEMNKDRIQNLVLLSYMSGLTQPQMEELLDHIDAIEKENEKFRKALEEIENIDGGVAGRIAAEALQLIHAKDSRIS